MASQRAYTPSQANLQEKKLGLARAHALTRLKISRIGHSIFRSSHCFLQPAERLSSLVPAASTGPLASPEMTHRTSEEKEAKKINSACRAFFRHGLARKKGKLCESDRAAWPGTASSQPGSGPQRNGTDVGCSSPTSMGRPSPVALGKLANLPLMNS